MSPQTETAIGTSLAVLGGIAFAFVLYFVLSTLFHIPKTLALPIAAIIGGLQYFILRYVLLVVGARK